MNAQQMMQMMQQRLGNMELTLHALLAVLDDEDVVDEDRINEKAQEIVEEMEEQQAGAHEGHDHE
ncbi:hypothetical protein [Candidatus Nanohalococcus occultus]|uniref:Uncharacterized protein n=2 Tax=Candidatus Nanohalococcus occultus TaxID=2978047 RepID=A0ABY8CJ75_9ARCH|nr:hypothetical protein SVXNc_0717 [Candidatus Nanohaloarchaeota archaeon SVXNc]